MTKARDLGDNAQNTKPKVVDAKGDLIVGTGSDAANRLAAGSNGDTLVADSSASTGLRWQGNFAAGKNAVINGDFRIWQRGTSFTNPAAVYTADRFVSGNVAITGSVSRQTFTAGSAPVAGYEGLYYARIDVTSGSQFCELIQKIEDARVFAGQTVTFSLWARLNSGNSGWQMNVVQNFGTGGSPSTQVLAGQTSIVPTGSWQRFTFTVAMPSVSGKTFGTNNDSWVGVTLQKTSTAASQIDTWGWQLEASNTATAFQTATGTLAGELAACQRYYYLAGSGSSKFLCNAYDFSTTQVEGVVSFPVTMRIAPTLDATSGTNYYGSRYSGKTFNSLTLYQASTTYSGVYATTTGLTAGNADAIYLNNAAASVAFTAEL